MFFFPIQKPLFNILQYLPINLKNYFFYYNFYYSVGNFSTALARVTGDRCA